MRKENSKKREDRFERGKNEGDQSEERRTFSLVTPANLSLEKEIERGEKMQKRRRRRIFKLSDFFFSTGKVSE